MKKKLTKNQIHKLRDLGFNANFCEISSTDNLIELLPKTMTSPEGEEFNLTIIKRGDKWIIQYVNFTLSKKLTGHVFYATELVDALYKAVKSLVINSHKVL